MRNIVSEYRIQSTGAGYLRATGSGWLRFNGRDRASFLQALLTNDVDALAPRTGGYGLYLTPQGRLIADLDLLNREGHFLAGVPAQLAGELATTFDRLIFAEDVQVSNDSSSLASIAVVGERAAEVAAKALAADSDSIRRLAAWSQLDAGDAFVVRVDFVSSDMFQIVAPSAAADAILVALDRAGAAPVSDDLIAAMRIDAARPAFGVDMTTETIPLEAGLLERAISQTKGCYVGQEVIIRVLHRGGGRVARRLVQMTALEEDAAVPPAGSTLLVEGREAGAVTSSAVSPAVGRARALGYVRREHAEIGTHVVIQWGESEKVDATITRFAS